MIEARYYKSEGDACICELCPHTCHIKKGNVGICRSRKNIGGKLYSLVYGHPCAIANDPVEKKPLAEWHPGTRCLSLACVGCNLRCVYCQNYEISQARPNEVQTDSLSPEQIVNLARCYHLPAIAYTYTEPLTWYEYTYDIARLAHINGLYNILVTAGYVTEEPLRAIAPYIDAANIDLKSFSDNIYHKINGASLEPVLRSIKLSHELGIHVEITNLLVTDINTDEALIRRMCQWLVDNDLAECPLHFSRFFPMYHLQDVQPTPERDLYKARDIAEDCGIHHVYLGNI